MNLLLQATNPFHFTPGLFLLAVGCKFLLECLLDVVLLTTLGYMDYKKLPTRFPVPLMKLKTGFKVSHLEKSTFTLFGRLNYTP